MTRVMALHLVLLSTVLVSAQSADDALPRRPWLGVARHETMERSRGNCGRGQEVSTLTDAVLAFLRTS